GRVHPYNRYTLLLESLLPSAVTRQVPIAVNSPESPKFDHVDFPLFECNGFVAGVNPVARFANQLWGRQVEYHRALRFSLRRTSDAYCQRSQDRCNRYRAEKPFLSYSHVHNSSLSFISLCPSSRQNGYVSRSRNIAGHTYGQVVIPPLYTLM